MSDDGRGRPTEPTGWQIEYREAVLEFGDPALLIVDLTLTPSPDVIATLGALLGPEPFAVITPCNPTGEMVSEDANARRVLDFESEVRVAWPEVKRCLGRSKSGHHREPGLAIPCTMEQARHLSTAWGQAGFYWYDGRQFSIQPALRPLPPLILPA